MRFGVPGFSRLFSAIASVFGAGSREIVPRRKQYEPPHVVGTKDGADQTKQRFKTGGPNWLKITLCGQKRRKIRC